MGDAPTDDGPRVLVCRGCCCGTTEKHPELDHEAQVEIISAVAPTRIMDCVGECANSNVIIVRPKPAELVWFGGMTSPALTEALCRWIEDGAPQPMPPILEDHAFLNATKRTGAS